jgi:hypothetical protein
VGGQGATDGGGVGVRSTGGLDGAIFAWGDEMLRGAKPLANF